MIACRRVFLLLILICLLYMSGCNNKPNILFEVGIDELRNIKVNQPFEITAYIKNLSKNTQEIFHGANMFTYTIVDEQGAPVPFESKFLHVMSISFIRSIKPGEVYRYNGEDHRSKKFYQYVINKPGIYKVQTTVQFRDASDQTGSGKDITLESWYQFSVD